MKAQFCSYEISLKLKELGFNEECFGAYYPDGELVGLKWYDNNNHRIESPKITAFLWQQAIDWFREKHNIIIEIWYDITQTDGFTWLYEIYVNNTEFEHDGNYFDNYYECREQAILKTIKLCQKEN